MKRSTLLAAAALAALGFVGVVRADITGTVKLEGKAPEMKDIDMSGVKECAAQHADPVQEETVVVGDGGGLANVVVALKPEDPSALGGEVPKQTAVLDQVGCQYVPHVIAMMVGQEMQVKNSDPFLHNVHSLANTNPAFNFGQPNKDPGKKVESPKAAEVYKVKCDVHPWMSAHVAVFEHPFFAVTDASGKFTIKGTVPDGEYPVTFWHEKYGQQEGKVTVADGKGTVDFSFKGEGADAGGQNPATPKLASTSGGAVIKTVANTKSAGGGESCGSCCEGEKSASTDKVAATK